MSSNPRSKRFRVLIASIFSLLVAFTVWYEVEALKMRQEIAAEALHEVERSHLLDKDIGLTIKAGYFVVGRVLGGADAGTADLKIPVSGPKGSGNLLVWSQNSFVGWRVCSMTFRPDSGRDIVIVSDETSKCERE